MNYHPDNIYTVILAAGESSRFGSPKQLAEWQNGNLLQHTIDLARSVFDKNIIVVLGAYAEKIQQSIDKQAVSIVINSDWQDGLSSSIKTGVKSLPDNALAVMILLCDQPLLNESSLKKLVKLWQQQADLIVASKYKNSVGVPAIFPASMFVKLESLSGDKGAKQLLVSLEDQVLTVSIPEAGQDIDTQQEFEHLKMQLKN